MSYGDAIAIDSPATAIDARTGSPCGPADGVGSAIVLLCCARLDYGKRVSGTEPAGVRSALRQSFETLFAKPLEQSLGETGYALDSFAYGDALEVTLRKGDARFVMWLRPAHSASASYRQTARFKIGYHEAPPDRSGFALLDVICAQIGQWERSLPDEADADLFDGQAIENPNLEMLAVRAGLKPACRYVVHPDTVATLVRDMQSQGLYSYVNEAPGFVSRFRWGFVSGETTIVYVGRTEQAARLAADLERSMMAGWRRWLWAHAVERKLGRALGYPACCIDEFLKIRNLPADVIRFHALARTAPTAPAALNDVDETQSVISHLTCRYDCVPSQRYAEALLVELGRVSRPAREVRQRALQGLVARFRDGGALRIELRERSSGPHYSIAQTSAFGSGPRLPAWQSALQDADGLAVGDGEVRILRQGREYHRLSAPAQDVQVRAFLEGGGAS